jgi:CBS-domain-containing membrane protein
MSTTVRSCAPEDDVRVALDTMRDGRVHRLPVVTKNGALVGVISIDDVLLRSAGAEASSGKVSAQEVVDAFRAINTHPLPVAIAKSAIA